jgi:translocation and assembly module TamB
VRPPRAARRGPPPHRGGLLTGRDAARRALAALGWAALAAAAAAGLALSAAALFAALPATRPLAARALVGWLDEAVDGSVELGGIGVVPGGVEVRALRVRDPDGREVLRVERARLFADATRLGVRDLTFALELEGLWLDAATRDEDGALALARAFAPTRPARGAGGRPPPSPPAPAGAPARADGPSWTFRATRIAVVGGRIALPGPGRSPIELAELALEARGGVGPREAEVELRAAGRLTAPAAAPAAILLRAARSGDRVELQRLEVAIGEDRLEAVAEGDLAARTGRLAVTRLGLSRSDAGAFAPAARLAGALSGAIYAESDGKAATAALQAAPAAGPGGRGAIAVAVALPPRSFAWGFSADAERLDPERLTLLAPRGLLTFSASGGARGARLADLEGRLGLALEPSRLRGGALGPVRLAARAGGGSVEIPTLAAAAPGGRVEGTLRWREGSAVGGELRAEVAELDRFVANLGELLGRPLPRLAGRARATVALAGTSRAPRLDANVEAPWLEAAGLRAERARLDLRLDGDAATLAFAAGVPALGSDPFRVELTGRFGAGRRSLDVEALTLAWPGSAFALAAPARVDLQAPAVDRLALASGAERVELEGGAARDGTLAARLRVAGLDLGRLPRDLLPSSLALSGALTLDARATGPRAAPRVEATVGLAGAEVLGVGGLSLLGEVAWDAAGSRAEADLELVRARGGAVALSLDAPLPIGRAGPAEPLRVELTARAVPLDELTWLAGSYALASGDVDASVTLGGTAGAPTLRASGRLRDGTWEELEGFELEGTLEVAGERARASAAAALDGRRVATAEAEARLDLGRLLRRPREALAATRTGAASLEGRVTDLELRRLAGWLGLPADLAGRLGGEARLGGRADAPRGTVQLALADGAGWGARAVGLRAELALADARTGGAVALALGGRDAGRLDARIDLAAERIPDRAALAAAPLQLDLSLPPGDLARWGGDLVALGGTVEGRASVRGTPGAPRAELRLEARGATIEGRPLGELVAEGRYVARRAQGTLDLRPPAGGALRVEGSLAHAFGLGAAEGPLRDAPAELHAVAAALDLGFLPAILPGIVRASAGSATLDLSASGPVGALRPRGSLRVANGRLAVAELGEWTGTQVDAELGEDALELRRFDVRKGTGRLSLTGSVRGLARPGPAEVEAKLESADFGVERSGIEFVRLDLKAEARGTLDRRELVLGIVLPGAEVRLPRRIPRTLQGTAARQDIAVGRPAPPRPRRERRSPAPSADAGAAAAPTPAEGPFRTVLHIVAPRRLHVRADQPRIDVELKGDVLLAFAGGRQEATGTIEAIRGQVEPIGGRVFVLERGKATFAGGPLAHGALDLLARWEAAKAAVRATVGGTLGRPQLHLSSEPPLEEAQIALLVATGRTEAKAGTGGVGALAAGDAGLAAAGALAMGVFKDLLSDKLPIDSVSLDSTALTAGKYLTDRIYVGYVRRFDAKPEVGENPDEVRVEYQLAPGWHVETRYGSGQAGGASIVWTRSW